MNPGPKPKNVIDRLFDAIPGDLDESICWVPNLQKALGGYRKIRSQKPSCHWVRTHRLVWEAYNAEPLGDRIVMHTCDNPGCCNPMHLVAGTQTDNMQDCLSKGRCRNRYTGKLNA
jgi:hypothetical protein